MYFGFWFQLDYHYNGLEGFETVMFYPNFCFDYEFFSKKNCRPLIFNFRSFLHQIQNNAHQNQFNSFLKSGSLDSNTSFLIFNKIEENIEGSNNSSKTKIWIKLNFVCKKGFRKSWNCKHCKLGSGGCFVGIVVLFGHCVARFSGLDRPNPLFPDPTASKNSRVTIFLHFEME